MQVIPDSRCVLKPSAGIGRGHFFRGENFSGEAWKGYRVEACLSPLRPRSILFMDLADEWHAIIKTPASRKK